jgi:hypothetical protein
MDTGPPTGSSTTVTRTFARSLLSASTAAIVSYNRCLRSAVCFPPSTRVTSSPSGTTAIGFAERLFSTPLVTSNPFDSDFPGKVGARKTGKWPLDVVPALVVVLFSASFVPTRARTSRVLNKP